MKIKIETEVARPKGHWKVEKWNLLKGETEADAAVINKDNLITDAFVKSLMTTMTYGSKSAILYLQFSTEEPTVEPTQVTSIADKSTPVTARLDGTPVYFYEAGVPANIAGKEVYGVMNQYSGNPEIFMWLKLDSPLLLEVGDVLRVSYKLDPLNLETVQYVGTIPYKTYAYGEDPEDPNAGTLVDDIDFTVSYSFSQEWGFELPEYAPVKNPDGSLSYGTDLKFKYKSATSSVNAQPVTISNVTCTMRPQSHVTRFRILSVNFPNTKPVHTPGSYYEVEVDFNVRVLPHV